MARLAGECSQEKKVHSTWRVHSLCHIERGPLTGPSWGLGRGRGSKEGRVGLELKAASLCPPDFFKLGQVTLPLWVSVSPPQPPLPAKYSPLYNTSHANILLLLLFTPYLKPPYHFQAPSFYGLITSDLPFIRPPYPSSSLPLFCFIVHTTCCHLIYSLDIFTWYCHLIYLILSLDIYMFCSFIHPLLHKNISSKRAQLLYSVHCCTPGIQKVLGIP